VYQTYFPHPHTKGKMQSGYIRLSAIGVTPDPFSSTTNKKWKKAVWLCETNPYLDPYAKQIKVHLTLLHAPHVTKQVNWRKKVGELL